jgi:hypothetical protein
METLPFDAVLLLFFAGFFFIVGLFEVAFSYLQRRRARNLILRRFRALHQNHLI